MITFDTASNYEEFSPNKSQHQPWEFFNKKSVQHNYHHSDTNLEQKISHHAPKESNTNEISLTYLNNTDSGKSDKKLQKSMPQLQDSKSVGEDNLCYNIEEKNKLEQDEYLESIPQDLEDNIKNIDDIQSIVLENGEEISIDELKDGYFRRQDCISHQKDILEQKGYLQNQAKILSQSAEALANLINNHIPAEPSPALAQTDPHTYHNMVDLRKKALAIVDSFVNVGVSTNHIDKEFETEFLSKKLELENEKLGNMFPQTKDPVQRESFFKNVFQVGKKLGFQEEEMQNIIDYRILALAYYAQLGLKSQKISNDVYNKTLNKPAVTIASKGKKYHNHHKIKSQEQAIKKFHSTGSLYDALDIDFV